MDKGKIQTALAASLLLTPCVVQLDIPGTSPLEMPAEDDFESSIFQLNESLSKEQVAVVAATFVGGGLVVYVSASCKRKLRRISTAHKRRSPWCFGDAIHPEIVAAPILCPPGSSNSSGKVRFGRNFFFRTPRPTEVPIPMLNLDVKAYTKEPEVGSDDEFDTVLPPGIASETPKELKLLKKSKIFRLGCTNL